MSSSLSIGKRAEDVAQQAASHPTLEFLERLLLGIVALGFVALGLHSFAAARWMKLLGSNS